jgi:hypothetical protein
MPDYRDSNDMLYRDPNDVRSRNTAHNAARRRYNVAWEWVAGAVFVVTGAVFLLALLATGFGIGHEPEMNAIQKAAPLAISGVTNPPPSSAPSGLTLTFASRV